MLVAVVVRLGGRDGDSADEGNDCVLHCGLLVLMRRIEEMLTGGITSRSSRNGKACKCVDVDVYCRD
jgi:hypothetical protein